MTRAQDAYAHLIGKVIDDRYEIMQVKGIGGMAVVLKARDRVKGRVVAIKMLNEKYSNDSAAIRRFVNESKAIALLSSDHIVDIYDVAFTGRSKYIVMEYIEGITLREYMLRNAPIGWTALWNLPSRSSQRRSTPTKRAWCTGTSNLRTLWSRRTGG